MVKGAENRFYRACKLLEPAFLAGFTFSDWLRLLRENDWEIDAKYVPRAVIATAGTLATSLLARCEPAPVLDRRSEEIWKRPVFVLGLPRSGTTHLFNLLASDLQFAFPTRLDCYNPHSFLFLRKLGIDRLLGRVPTKKRLMDNVRTGWLTPEEDDIALAVLSGLGSRLRWVFYRNTRYRLESQPGNAMSDGEREAFQSALIAFSRKLVALHGRRCLFKSPSHTRAVPEILEIFPGARFVTVLRDPHEQFASMAAMQRAGASGWSALQARYDLTDDDRLRWIEKTVRRYAETRGCIPSGQLVEIHYNDLVNDCRATMEKVYSALGLGELPQLEDTQAYKRNRHADLSPDLRVKITNLYRPFSNLGFQSRVLTAT